MAKNNHTKSALHPCTRVVLKGSTLQTRKAATALATEKLLQSCGESNATATHLLKEARELVDIAISGKA